MSILLVFFLLLFPDFSVAREEIHDKDSSLNRRYGEEQITFLLEFLKYSNTLSRQELVRWQEAPSGGEGTSSAPREDQESGRLVVSCGISRLSLRADDKMVELYRARFEGLMPKVKTKEGVVTIRYPRSLLGRGDKQGAAEIALSSAIPWQIVIQGSAAEVAAELGGLTLTSLETTGGFSTIFLDLSVPSGVVPIRIRGGASEITVRHPAGVAARLKLKGWVSELAFDGQTSSGVGNNMQLQNPGFDPHAPCPCYDIEITSYANRVTITSETQGLSETPATK